MTYTTSDKTTVDKLEKSFTAQFIKALKKDISSSKHGTQTNSQVLHPAIHLLENRHLSPQLSLEQIVRGALNMALCMENYKYRNINSKSVGSEQYTQYLNQVTKWFGDYGEQLKVKPRNFDKIAIPVIERASKGPLFMMTNCVQQTIDLYFEYTKLFDSTFEKKRLLLIGSSEDPKAAKKFRFDIFTPEIDTSKQSEIIKSKEPDIIKPEEENAYFLGLFKNLSDRIEILKNDPNTQENSVNAASDLYKSLDEAYRIYVKSKEQGTVTKDVAKTTFLDSCTLAINTAKPLLEKELGWGEYLQNLLKSIANAFISATNTVTKSKIAFFTPDKAPMVSEVENIEEQVKDFKSPPSS